MKENNKISDEQVKQIYNHLANESENSKADILEKASNETDNVVYMKNEIMKEQGLGTPSFNEDDMRNLGLDEDTIESLKDVEIDDIEEINETKSDYMNIFKDYDINDEDGLKLFKVITRYKNKEKFDIYNELPNSIRVMVDSLLLSSNCTKNNKNAAAAMIIDSFINDAKFGKAIDDYVDELNNIMLESNKEFQYLFQDSINEIYEKIDEIRETDPEKAEQIESIKYAFEQSSKFESQLEYLNHISSKKLNKFYDRFDNECFYFNKKVNKTDVVIPDIRKIVPIIKKALPGFTEKQIKLFVIVIIKSTNSLDVENIIDLAYVYRMISNITAFEFNTDFESDYAKEIFGNITAVIQKIINLN